MIRSVAIPRIIGIGATMVFGLRCPTGSQQLSPKGGGLTVTDRSPWTITRIRNVLRPACFNFPLIQSQTKTPL
jgi:hypothetical protein